MKLAGGRPRPDCGQSDLALAFGLALALIAGVVALALWVTS